MPSPRPKNRRFLVTALLLIAISIGGYAVWTLLRIDALGKEAYALRVRASSALRPAVAGSGLQEVHAEIAALDAWLEANAPAASGTATPAQWNASVEQLERTLGPIEPFFEQVDALYSRPGTGALVLAGCAAPRASSLASTRNWTNLIAARALLDAERGGWSDAGRRLAQALDLARLRDDGTMLGASVRASSESVAIGAVRRVLARADADAGALRAQVEPALMRAADARLVAAAIASELARWSDEGRTIPRRCLDRCRWLVRPYHFAWAKEELAAYTEVVGEALRQADGGASAPLDANGHLVLARTTFENEASAAKTCLEISLLARSRVAVARVALALCAHAQEHGEAPARLEDLAHAFDGAVPRDPCSSEPLRFVTEGGVAAIGPTAFAVARGLDERQSSALLLRWSSPPSRP